jgi:hypothetical protein
VRCKVDVEKEVHFPLGTAVIFEVLRMTLLAGDEGDLQKREWPK